MDMENSQATAESKWTSAARDGVFLALVTIIPQTISALVDSAALGMLLWAVKFAGSIWILMRFMKRFAASGTEGSVSGYGIRVCLFSTIICAAYAFAMYSFIFPDLVTEAFEQIPALLEGKTLPEEAEDMLLKMEDNFAQYAFTATLIWDFICGLILSAILAGPASQASLFAGEESGNQEEEL